MGAYPLTPWHKILRNIQELTGGGNVVMLIGA